MRLDVSPLSEAEIRRRMAWASGSLEFENTPLPEVITEFRRYSRERIVVDDSAADVRVTGRFKIDDMSRFKKALKDLPRLQVLEGPNETRITANPSVGKRQKR